MCNYYTVPDHNPVAAYFRTAKQLPLPLPRGVGPFNQGLFLRPTAQGLSGFVGQWGMIRPGLPERYDYVVRNGVKTKQKRQTNNCRLDSIVPPPGARQKPTFAAAWTRGQRCLIPAQTYQEPNWETRKNIWWNLARADGLPWAIAGLWSEWTDPQTGEVVPNFTAITVNCDDHPLLNRLHKHDPKLPNDQQDKRSLVHVEPQHWSQWLEDSAEQALELLTPAPVEMFDRADADQTDALLQAARLV